MNVKIFQKNLTSDEKFKIMDKEINDWLEANSGVRIYDLQFSVEVIRFSNNRNVYSKPICLIFYELLSETSDRPAYQVKLFSFARVHNSQLDLGFGLEQLINPWLEESSKRQIESIRFGSASTTWEDDRGFYWYFYQTACLILFRQNGIG